MEDTSIRLYEEEKRPLTLELVGTPQQESKEEPRKIRVSIDRIEQDKLGNRRLVVSLPPVIDRAHAGCAVDLLLDRWDDDHILLHTLIIKGLRWTEGGLAAMTTFFGMQSVVKSIEQVMFHDIIGGQNLIMRQDENAVYTICKTLRSAPNLQMIDLSRNCIGGYVWEALGPQFKLKQLTLDNVEMDDASFQELKSHFVCEDSLQSFTISNRTRTGPSACQALDEMLRSCRNLRTFAYKQQPDRAQESLPLVGLASVSKNMFKNDFYYMTHLELTGGSIPADPSMLCNALEGFHKLQSLKLSRAHLNSEKIQRVVTALRSARPPLAAIDFSHNQIDCEGASWIAQLSCLRAITKNLRLLNLEHNRIAQKGALDVVESFASKASDFSLNFDGNAFDPCQMFLSLASSKYKAETELKELRKDCDRLREDKQDAQSNLRELLKAQSTMINDMHELKTRAKQLEEDKESLIKAFGVLGMMRHVEERDSILTRLTQLEDAVHGKAPRKNGKKEHSKTRPPQPTCLSNNNKKAPKAKSFDDAIVPTSWSRKATRAASLDNVGVSSVASFASVASHPQQQQQQQQQRGSLSQSSSSNNQRTRSSSRPGTARNLLVKAASERWKSLLKNESPKQPEKRKARALKPQRAASQKSLAEFLNRSAPDLDGFMNDDSSFCHLEDDSVQTTPVPRTLGGARRRIRQGQNGSSTRSLPPRDESKSALSSTRSLPPRDQSKSMQSPPPLDKMLGDSYSSSLDFARRGHDSSSSH